MTRRLSLIAASIAALALIAVVRPASAATAQSNLTVTATVNGACTIAPATAFGFGFYNPTVAALDAQTDITINCTQGTSYWVGLDQGANFSGGRRMTNGTGEFLSYELYRSAADRTAGIVWDNTNGGLPNATANTVAPGLSPYTVTVFGRIPMNQTVSTGLYSDTVVMTVNF
jgi:spore coat protein U-like protein